DEHLASLDIDSSGAVVITFSSPQLAGQTMVWKPTLDQQRGTWDCSGGSLANRCRPSHCRATAMPAHASRTPTETRTFYSTDGLDSLELGNGWQPLDLPDASMAYIQIGRASCRERG